MRVSAMVNCVLLGAILLSISVGSCIASRPLLSNSDGPKSQIETHITNCFFSEEYVTCNLENVTLVFRRLIYPFGQLSLISTKYHGDIMVMTWRSREPVASVASYFNERSEVRGRVTLLTNVTKLESITASSPVEKFFKFSLSLLPSKAQSISSLVTRKDGHFIPSSSLKFILGSIRGSLIERLEIPGCIEGSPTRRLYLRSMPELRYLDVSNNGIDEFNKEVFPGMPKLERLLLQNNTLNYIPPYLQFLHNLKYLDMSHNRKILHALNFSYTGRTLDNLEVLKMSNTRLNFSLKEFSALESVKELYIDGCHMYHTFVNNTFEKFPRLHMLNISNLTAMFDDSLTLPNLTLLDVSRVSVSKLPTFYSSSVTYLYASHNNIRSLDELGLQIDTVKYLNLSYNHITGWWFKEPKFWNGLFEIDLRHNRIEMVTGIIRKSLNNVKRVYLRENPFNCKNCETREFQLWLNKARGKVIDFRDLLCHKPYSNISLLEFTAYDESCNESSVPNLWLAVGIPVGLFAITATLSLCFRRRHNRNRAKLEYMKFLDGIMNYPEETSSTKKHEYIYDVFVCYSHKNRRFVFQTLLPFLESGEEKFRACLHERDFPLGSDIIDNIVRAVQRSRNIMMIVSNDFIRSKWCKYELKLSNHILVEENTRLLILVQIEPLDGVSIPEHLKQHMLTKTYLEWPEKDRNTSRGKYKRLKSALAPSLYQQSKEVEVSVPVETDGIELVPLSNVQEDR